MKISQPNIENRDEKKRFLMITIMSNIWINYKYINQDIRFLYVLAGVEFVNKVNPEFIKSINYDYKHPTIQKYFEKNVLKMSREDLYNEIKQLWDYPTININRWI
jgi:hypothetical protein